MDDASRGRRPEICDILEGGSEIFEFMRREGSKIAKNNLTYFTDGSLQSSVFLSIHC